MKTYHLSSEERAFLMLERQKATSLRSIAEQLDHIAWLLNTRPRKRYDFKSSQYMMERELEGGLISIALDS